jgi:hypothetical protein
MLLNPNIDKKEICSAPPVDVRKNASYVIDKNCLDNPEDIKKDNIGVWHHTGSHNNHFNCHINSGGEVLINNNNRHWKH